MLNAPLPILEACLFGGGVVMFMLAVGAGVTELLVPGDGLKLLLAPVVGLAILSLAFQWLTFWTAPAPVAVAVFVVFVSVSAYVIRTRRTARPPWVEVALVAGFAAAYFVTLLQLVVQRGALTLGSFPADNIFIYAQAAQYLRDHAMPAPGSASSMLSTGSWYLSTVGPSFPHSVGVLDASASALTGWPVHAVFDILSGVALALTGGPVWFFVRHNLGGSRIAAAMGVAMLGASQLVYWVFGLGLQQECLSLPIFAAALCCVALALRTGSRRAAALVGLLTASLVGMYPPIAALFVFCAGLSGLVWVAGPDKGGFRRLLAVAGIGAATGLIASLAAAYVLVFQGGLAVWRLVLGARYAAGAVSRFPSAEYLLGTMPFAHVWELHPLPLGHLETVGRPLMLAGSALLPILLIFGFARAVTTGRAAEGALLGGGMLFALYEVAVAQYPYGFVKSIGYLSPMISVFVAFGATQMGAFAPPRRHRIGTIAGAAAGVLVLLLAANASRDMLRLWLESPPALSASDLRIASMASAVPLGSKVFIDDPTDDYGTLVRVAAIAYFLPDREVRVYVGDTRLGTFPNQNVRASVCGYDYVIRAATPGDSFTAVDREPVTGLNVYRRTGPGCAG